LEGYADDVSDGEKDPFVDVSNVRESSGIQEDPYEDSS